MMTRYQEYDSFAQVYNEHWGAHTLRKFCPILEALFLPLLLPQARVLDLCCGTGHLAHWLSDQGYQMTGLDGSEGMLRYARENAPEASFILADARFFLLPSSYQAVISTFDSLNHLLTVAELTAAFRNAYTALVPGGMLFCDLNIRRGFIEHGKSDFGIVEGDHVCVVRTHYDDELRLAYWDITIFNHHGTWERTDLTLTQHAYEEEEICLALNEAGFSDIQVFDNEHCPESLPSLPFGRAFFLARKES